MRLAIVTVSDTCAQQPSADRSGPELNRLLHDALQREGVKAEFAADIVADDVEAIRRVLRKHIDASTDVIVTTGGTGFSPHINENKAKNILDRWTTSAKLTCIGDVTPEATRTLIQRPCPGIVVALLNAGLASTPNAALSRLEAGIVESCLIINLPGSVSACRDAVPVLAPLLPHAVALLRDNQRAVRAEHAAHHAVAP